MTVYVDDMADYHPPGEPRLARYHMIADTERELQDMAGAIGATLYVRGCYNLAPRHRARAIDRGARSITWRQLAAMVTLRKMGQPAGIPETAYERLRDFHRTRAA